MCIVEARRLWAAREHHVHRPSESLVWGSLLGFVPVALAGVAHVDIGSQFAVRSTSALAAPAPRVWCGSEK